VITLGRRDHQQHPAADGLPGQPGDQAWQQLGQWRGGRLCFVGLLDHLAVAPGQPDVVERDGVGFGDLLASALDQRLDLQLARRVGLGDRDLGLAALVGDGRQAALWRDRATFGAGQRHRDDVDDENKRVANLNVDVRVAT
jgi:hypothetical protein